MALREIIILPDKRLRLVSEPVKTVDAEVRALVDDMFETMYEAPGVGLAAIQVGVPKRIVTADTAKKDEEKQPQVFINPEIVWSSEEKATYEEGCLSIPEYYEEVERPAQVKVRFTDLDGKTHEIEANGLLATVLQHEIDHLNGVLFIDHISKLKRDRVIKKFTKAAKRADDVMRLIFMGTPDFAVPTLVEIVGRGHEVAAVYTRAPKPAGRGMELQVTPVEREARRFGIPVLTPKTLRTDEAAAAFRAHGADAAVVVAYGLILPVPDSRSRAARLLQSACLAAAALARRRADQPRHHGGRRGERRDGDADGGGARHRPDRAGRARCRSAPT